jgi:hypothetical protein
MNEQEIKAYAEAYVAEMVDGVAGAECDAYVKDHPVTDEASQDAIMKAISELTVQVEVPKEEAAEAVETTVDTAE